MPTHENHARDFLRHLGTAQSEAARKEQFVTYFNQVFAALLRPQHQTLTALGREAAAEAVAAHVAERGVAGTCARWC